MNGGNTANEFDQCCFTTHVQCKQDGTCKDAVFRVNATLMMKSHASTPPNCLALLGIYIHLRLSFFDCLSGSRLVIDHDQFIPAVNYCRGFFFFEVANKLCICNV
jgi:hypothetical protein